MLNSTASLARRLSSTLLEVATTQRAALNPTSMWALITSGRANLSLTARSWKEEKKPELFIHQVLSDFDGRGVQDSDGRIKSENAFRLFKLDEKLMIDEVRLKREMIKLQRTIHPDKFMKTGRETHEKTERLSSLVNESYEILRHPYKRAKYLLGLKWNKSQDEIERLMDSLQLDPDFLSNMMDLREMINSTRSPQQLMKMSAQVQSDLDDLILAVDRDFKSKNYESVLERLGKLKFIASCHVALQDKLGDTGSF